MAIKKSELYSSLWASCDALRGGMEPTEYKNYVLVILFIKYISDKYANDPNGLIEIPEGSSFKDMVALKGKKDIGEKINTQIIGKLAEANDLKGVIDVVDFDDDDKLGKDKEMVYRLDTLISIFENPALDFSKNKAEGDDILGDAYEYLMRFFATASGKSKGEFYTPSEVSRVIAKVIGISPANSSTHTSVYDPTCGSGSLLLKVADEAQKPVSLYGQEKTTATAALARMNMILHNNETGMIEKGQSTLSNPLFSDPNGDLKTFDYVVANPPFSLRDWAAGFKPHDDIYQRFEGFGIPPDKNGDFAFLLHILKSMRSTGKGACILPHGVLFRGNAEAEIRKNIIRRGYIKGIIGLPPNLFYGTGIPACILVLDKEHAATRNAIFMIDAGKGYMKDGNKNRLREQDIHKIVDVFNKQLELPKYSRLVPIDEISDPKNDYNLNIPRYIDSQEAEDLQDIEAHLKGGIPVADIDALGDYWQVYPSLQKVLFEVAERPGYLTPRVEKDQVKNTIFHHPEFENFRAKMDRVFADWKNRNTQYLKSLEAGCKPKQVIHQVSEDALATYADRPLIDKYDVYQHVMNFWADTMQDDCYLIAADGWNATPYRIIEKTKSGKEVDKGWTCDLVPPALVIDRYFPEEKKALELLEAQRETLEAQIVELEEEQSTEEGVFAGFEKLNKAAVARRLKNLKSVTKGKTEEISILQQYLQLHDEVADLNADIKKAAAELDHKTLAHYATLSHDQIQQLVVDDKWMAAIERSLRTELDRISQRLTSRIDQLTERYRTPLPALTREVADLEATVTAHLQKMGFVWE